MEDGERGDIKSDLPHGEPIDERSRLLRVVLGLSVEGACEFMGFVDEYN